MKTLVLTVAIHDLKITMVKPARAGLTIPTGLAVRFEWRTVAKAERHNELRLPTLSKQRLIIAVPSHPRFPSPVKVQVRSSRHISLSSPWLHQRRDGPPQSREQWAAPLPSLWSESCALRKQVRARTRKQWGHRPRCVVRSLLHPIPSCREHTGKATPQNVLFSLWCPANPTPNIPTRSR